MIEEVLSKTIESVLNTHLDAAFASSAMIDEAVEKHILDPDQVMVLWRPNPIYYALFVFSSGMDTDLKDRIQESMLSIFS